MDWGTVLARRAKRDGWSLFPVYSNGADMASPLTHFYITNNCGDYPGWSCDATITALLAAFAKANATRRAEGHRREDPGSRIRNGPVGHVGPVRDPGRLPLARQEPDPVSLPDALERRDHRLIPTIAKTRHVAHVIARSVPRVIGRSVLSCHREKRTPCHREKRTPVSLGECVLSCHREKRYSRVIGRSVLPCHWENRTSCHREKRASCHCEKRSDEAISLSWAAPQFSAHCSQRLIAFSVAQRHIGWISSPSPSAFATMGSCHQIVQAIQEVRAA